MQIVSPVDDNTGLLHRLCADANDEVVVVRADLESFKYVVVNV